MTSGKLDALIGLAVCISIYGAIRGIAEIVDRIEEKWDERHKR